MSNTRSNTNTILASLSFPSPPHLRHVTNGVVSRAAATIGRPNASSSSSGGGLALAASASSAAATCGDMPIPPVDDAVVDDDDDNDADDDAVAGGGDDVVVDDVDDEDEVVDVAESGVLSDSLIRAACCFNATYSRKLSSRANTLEVIPTYAKEYMQT